MGYLHIDNLYKDQSILVFRKGYVLEKVHGTSAHIKFKWIPKTLVGFPADDGNPEYQIDRSNPDNLEIGFFSGGEKHENFVRLFDEEALKKAFIETGIQRDLTVYGEAYGGKQQGMKHVYGPDLRFIAFDVKHGDRWMGVEQADRLVQTLGLEFVPWHKVELTLEELDKWRDAPSEVAVRRGMGDNCWREGIVIRPPIEVFFGEEGGRIIAKHKRPEARETKTQRNVGDKALEFASATALAEEWVTEMRLQHALDKLPGVKGIEQVKDLIAYMVEDVLREGAGEVQDNKANRQAIGTQTVKLFKRYLNGRIKLAVDSNKEKIGDIS